MSGVLDVLTMSDAVVVFSIVVLWFAPSRLPMLAKAIRDSIESLAR